MDRNNRDPRERARELLIPNYGGMNFVSSLGPILGGGTAESTEELLAGEGRGAGVHLDQEAAEGEEVIRHGVRAGRRRLETKDGGFQFIRSLDKKNPQNINTLNTPKKHKSSVKKMIG